MPISVTIRDTRLLDHAVTHDERGGLSEVFRASALGRGGSPGQWNCVRSRANVLRGVHAHSMYEEYYVAVTGRMFFALKDARASSTSFGAEMAFWSEDLGARTLVVPAGVAHGVYFETDGVLVYGLSREWTGQGEHACRWDDPLIAVSWPVRGAPILSEKDASAGDFQALVAGLARA